MKPTAALIAVFLASGFLVQASPAKPSPSDVQAVALARSAYLALTGGQGVQDATITASATWIAGSDQQTGTATLEALGSGNSRVTLILVSGQRTEIRSALTGAPAGSWAGPDGVAHSMAFHNCQTDAAWFFPALSLSGALSDPQVVFSYVGQETLKGSSVQHIRYSRQVTGQSAAATRLFGRLGTTDVYLDAASLLPVTASFQAHPDGDAGTDIPVQILFSNYQAVNGIRVPMRVQKLVQGGLVLDLAISSATINSGLPASDFIVQ